jgi:hypothetical protein
MRWHTWYSAVLGVAVAVAFQLRWGLVPTHTYWRAQACLALGIFLAAFLTERRRGRR